MRNWRFYGGCLATLLMVFVMVAGRAAAQGGDVKVETDVEYGVADGQKLLLDTYCLPAPAGGKLRPAVVLVHGGGWVGGSKRDFRDAGMGLSRAGYVVFSVEYRLVKADSNKYPAQLDDVQRAVRWVRANSGKYSVDPERIGAMGGSAGGHLVALLGTCDTRDNSDPALAKYSSRVQCVVDINGPADLTQPFAALGGGLPVQALVTGLIGKPLAEAPQAYRDASAVFHVDKKSAPFIILHGTADPIVPIDQSVRLHEALQKAGVESTLLKLEGEGHGFKQKENVSKMIVASVEFLKKHLQP